MHILYLTVANVLLINLLIAMFSNTFDRLQADTDCIWKFQHYSLVCYHLTRPSLPPPLVFLSHIWRGILYLVSSYSDIKWFKEKYIQHRNKEKFRRTKYFSK
jgi:tryptophan-rich sensory protein